MTTLNHEHVTPERLVSPQLGLTCGAVLPGTKRGATVSTPNGRLVSEDVIGRRTQSPPDPRAARRRSFPYAHKDAAFSFTAVPEHRQPTECSWAANPTTVELDGPPSWAAFLGPG